MIVAAKLRFHEFEFDTRRLELRKHGHRVRVPASQLRLLSLFLERPGELITREEIVARLWTETGTIDVVSGVNTAINRLRFHLGDNADTPHSLETVIGLGYRFIAPVEEIHTAASTPQLETTPAPSTPEAPIALRPPTSRALLWAAGLSVAVLLVLVWIAIRHHQAAPGVGHASRPLSFIQTTFDRGGNRVITAAISPDGTLLAYADSAGIRVQALASQKETTLPELPTFSINHLSWFPSENELAVSGTDLTTHRDLIWRVPLASMSTVSIATDAEFGTVAPNGHAVALLRSHRSELWLADPDGTNLRRLANASPQSEFSFLLWSSDGHRILLVSHDTPSASTAHPGHWLYESIDASTGKLLAREEIVAMESAAIFPSGELRYISAASPTRGTMFSLHIDLATGRFLDTPIEVQHTGNHGFTNLSASTDGTRLAFIEPRSSIDTFTASLIKRANGIALDDIHRVTSALSDAYPHAWSNDGRIFFESEHQDHLALFSQRPGDALPTVAAQPPMDTIMAQLSPDHQFLLFLGVGQRSPAADAIYRVPLNGGEPQRIPGTTGADEFRCARTGPIACVMRQTRENQERLYFALDPVTGVGSLLARTPWQPSRRGDWGLSPDGSTIVVANRDGNNPALNFLKLNGSSAYERSLPIRGHGSPIGAGWAVDGKTLFVETRATNSLELLSVTFDGRIQLLRKSAAVIWAIPSPDGKQIAFPAFTDNANVWVNAQ